MTIDSLLGVPQFPSAMATIHTSTSATLTLTEPLPLDSGQALESVEIAYETYGELAQDKSNAILIFHALTMDQYVANPHPITGKQMVFVAPPEDKGIWTGWRKELEGLAAIWPQIVTLG